MDIIHGALAILCGGLVGFTLGLIGGGGSIMATPLLLYVVGLQPHVAIGTGALAVSANALSNFGSYARKGMVRWPCAIMFAVTGIAGATVGSFVGKQIDGERLLFLFALLMVVVGVMMLRRKGKGGGAKASSGFGSQDVCRLWQPTARSPVPLLTTAFGVGTLSGFFGIGGGFLIVPGLLFATGMPMICAIGSSLLAVGTFGLTTAVSYGTSGFVDWLVAVQYILGGFAGGLLGMKLARSLADRHAVLNRIFAGFVFIVAAYMIYRNAAALQL